MRDPNENDRKTKRVDVRFRADYDTEHLSGTGLVDNVSAGGALIGNATTLLLRGTEVKIRFSFFKNSAPVEIPAEVIRETDNGFAVRFTFITARTKAIITRAVALAAAEAEEDEKKKRTLF